MGTSLCSTPQHSKHGKSMHGGIHEQLIGKSIKKRVGHWSFWTWGHWSFRTVTPHRDFEKQRRQGTMERQRIALNGTACTYS
jgi:hypothetical protein